MIHHHEVLNPAMTLTPGLWSIVPSLMLVLPLFLEELDHTRTYTDRIALYNNCYSFLINRLVGEAI